MSDEEPKPVLWVACTEADRASMEPEGMVGIEETVQDAVGDDYHVVVADDKVRLATLEDLQELRDALDDLVAGELETRGERRERLSGELGLETEDDA